MKDVSEMQGMSVPALEAYVAGLRQELENKRKRKCQLIGTALWLQSEIMADD